MGDTKRSQTNTATVVHETLLDAAITELLEWCTAMGVNTGIFPSFIQGTVAVLTEIRQRKPKEDISYAICELFAAYQKLHEVLVKPPFSNPTTPQALQRICEQLLSSEKETAADTAQLQAENERLRAELQTEKERKGRHQEELTIRAQKATRDLKGGIDKMVDRLEQIGRTLTKVQEGEGTLATQLQDAQRAWQAWSEGQGATTEATNPPPQEKELKQAINAWAEWLEELNQQITEIDDKAEEVTGVEQQQLRERSKQLTTLEQAGKEKRRALLQYQEALELVRQGIPKHDLTPPAVPAPIKEPTNDHLMDRGDLEKLAAKHGIPANTLLAITLYEVLPPGSIKNKAAKRGIARVAIAAHKAGILKRYKWPEQFAFMKRWRNEEDRPQIAHFLKFQGSPSGVRGGIYTRTETPLQWNPCNLLTQEEIKRFTDLITAED